MYQVSLSPVACSRAPLPFVQIISQGDGVPAAAAAARVSAPAGTGLAQSWPMHNAAAPYEDGGRSLFDHRPRGRSGAGRGHHTLSFEWGTPPGHFGGVFCPRATSDWSWIHTAKLARELHTAQPGSYNKSRTCKEKIIWKTRERKFWWKTCRDFFSIQKYLYARKFLKTRMHKKKKEA